MDRDYNSIFEKRIMKHLELYSDYLICNATGYATATGLSAMIDGVVSHDQITRFFVSRKTEFKRTLVESKTRCTSD
jgi:hypothetical protein